MTVTEKRYWEDKDKFFKKHHGDFQCYTSSMNEYGCWYKDYVFADGAQWHEDYMPVWEEASATVQLHCVNVELKKDIKFLRTEYYNTDNAESNYTYELY